MRQRLISMGATVLLMALAGRVGANTLVILGTPVGDLEFELFSEDKPITVANFLRYARSNRYENSFIERWNPGFVIQGGGQVVSNRWTAPQVVPVPSFGEITNEYGVGQTYSNVYGTIAMARRGGETNSATSSWFVNLGDNSFLDGVDGGFTVFGRLLRGTNVLNKFMSLSSAIDAGIGWVDPNPFHIDLLPVNTTNETATFGDLIYVDVEILEVAIDLLPNGDRGIAWNSVSNKLNTVEWLSDLCATNWAVLLQTNGTGAAMQAVDTHVGPSPRMYRIRVQY